MIVESRLIGKKVRNAWAARTDEPIGTVEAVAYDRKDGHFYLLIQKPHGGLTSEKCFDVEVVSE